MASLTDKDQLPEVVAPAAPVDRWTLDFQRGTKAIFESIYREYFLVVEHAVGRILTGADKETVIHDVFCRIMSNSAVRERFRGGSFPAWLSTLARNQAVDFHRRRRLEQPVGTGPEAARQQVRGSFEPQAMARLLLQRFSQTQLPQKWERVFQLRFVQELDQRDAASQLGISRTTLAYREHRIRKLLRRFVLEGEA